MNKKQIIKQLEKDPRMIIPLLQDNDFAWARELFTSVLVANVLIGQKVRLVPMAFGTPAYRLYLERLATLTPDEQLEYVKENV